jgi:hypothetical protein
MVPPAVFQATTPSKRAKGLAGRRILAFGIHFWRAGWYASRSAAGTGWAMFDIIACSLIMNNAFT